MNKHAIIGIWSFFAFVIIGIAIIVAVARVFFPYLQDYRTSFESFASRYMQQPVRIENVTAEWRWLSPSLTFHKVIILDDAGRHVLGIADEIIITINTLKSIAKLSLEPSSLTVSGVNFTVQQQKDGSIRIPE